MFDLHLGGKRGKSIAIADIGGGSVAFAVVSIRPNTPTEILAAERQTLPLEGRTKEATIAALEANFTTVGEKALRTYRADKKNVLPIEKIYCIVRSPWSRSKSVRAAANFNVPTLITPQTIAGLAKEALADEKELDQKQLLEAAVVRVELNGYETRLPEKKTAEHITVTALISDWDPDMRASVAAALGKIAPHVTAIYSSSTRALLSALRELPDHEEDHLVVEIGSESSTLTVVRSGAMEEQRVVPEGINSMLKRIDPSGMPEQSISLIRMLGRDQCSSAACEEIQNAIAKAEPDLVRSFADGMAACATSHKLPVKLILVGQSDFLPWLSKFFTRIDFTQFTATTQPFSVEALREPQQLQTRMTGSPSEDIGLAIGISLVNREESRR